MRSSCFSLSFPKKLQTNQYRDDLTQRVVQHMCVAAT